MKVLMVNSFHYYRGGSERCFFELSAALERLGHEVVPFSMQHPNNLPSEYDDYFLSYMDFPSKLGKGSSLKDKWQVAERVIYSREARDKIARLIELTKPDIAHVHGIAHETSPSILPAIKQAGIPVVQTLHDYKLMCPNTNFVSQGEVCERCKGHRYYNVVRRRCKRGSLAASALAAVEMTVHKTLHIYERNVDTFIAPSQFLKEKLHEYGIRNQVVNVPNGLDLDRFEPCYTPENYFVFFGRLVNVKGVQTLLEAMRHVPDGKLIIAGSGDLEDELKQFARVHNLHNVEFLGHVNSGLVELIQRAAFSVVPSEWYENYSMSVIESLACGTPVVGARIGGIPEQVHDGINGLLFESGNAVELAEKINAMLADPAKTIEMGHNGRAQVEQQNSLDIYTRRTIDVYEDLLQPQREAIVASAH